MRRCVAVLALVGCGPTVELPGGDATGDSSSGSTAVPGATSSTAPPDGSTTRTSSTSAPDDTGFVTFSSHGSTTTDGWGGFTTQILSESSDAGLCMSNDDCDTGMCYLAGILGGICGECLSDADCTWGCSPPNPLTDPPTGAMCNDGMIGDGCQTDAACVDGLLCGPTLDIPGILSIHTCGECLQDADCTDGTVCSPDVSLPEFGGQHECVEPGSKADGETCSLDGSGEECASTHCAEANIMDLVHLGICSECSDDEGCDPGQACESPTVDLDGTVVPATCV